MHAGGSVTGQCPPEQLRLPPDLPAGDRKVEFDDDIEVEEHSRMLTLPEEEEELETMAAPTVGGLLDEVSAPGTPLPDDESAQEFLKLLEPSKRRRRN